MTKEEFLNEEAFTYNGHFNGLKGKELQFKADKNRLDVRERRTDQFDYKKKIIEFEPWEIIAVQEKRVIIFKQEFGRVSLFYIESELING